MKDPTLYGIYTITLTHCGTGQGVGAVDLPIAREAHNGFPLIPSTGLKGVARRALEMPLGDRELEAVLFGSRPPSSGETAESDGDGGSEKGLRAGNLVFTDARLLLFPIRSLQRAFFYVTCPLLLGRLYRDLGAFAGDGDGFLGSLWPAGWRGAYPGEVDGAFEAVVSDSALNRQPLVLEDVVFKGEEVSHEPKLEILAKNLASALLSEGETLGRQRLPRHVVVVPDTALSDLVQRAIPATARTQLTGGKTTDNWLNRETKDIESGNLWYEEHLPTDCLFYGFVGQALMDRAPNGGEAPMATYRKHSGALNRVQIGGNEGIGHGQVWWHHHEPAQSARRGKEGS